MIRSGLFIVLITLTFSLFANINDHGRFAVDKKILLCTCLHTIKINVDLVEFSHPNLEGVFRVIEEDHELHLYFEDELIAGFIEKYDYSIETEGNGIVIYRLNKKGKITDEYHLVPNLRGDESVEFVLLRPENRTIHQ